MSLYQKYRPRDFNSLVGQEFIKISLKNALKQNKLVGAYLFYGSRGTGKTTTARILAKGVNCLALTEEGNPCLECVNCKAFENEELIDIIEIDAASNTGVDNIRDLIEKAQFQPNQSKYKVYIIDEVHMLSKGAFNALLKTLEEPPKHVKFILATTEIHKIPDTIISRTQRYDFKKITENDIVERLRFIGHSESINAEEDALELIARLSKGGLRDAISFFEQYSIGGSLKLDYLKDNLQLVGDEFLEDFLSNITKYDYPKVIDNLSFLKEKGIDIKIFLEEFIYFLHSRILENNSGNEFIISMNLYDSLIEIYSKLKSVPNTFLLLEFSIIKFLKNDDITNYSNIVKKENPKVSESPRLIIKEEKIEPKKDIKIDSTEKEENNENTKDFEIGIFLDSIKKDAGKGFILMSLKSSKLVFKQGVLKVYASNDFNYNKLSTPEIRAYLEDKLNSLFGIQTNIELISNKNETSGNDIISDAMSVF
ncbi:MAG: DNA polymerase III subunit gamma/tau [Candidatus Gracilibacteria bacterium]|nr:DNA polymerase III subunit gamma/tau [Candidatus Gracilibacteria bacterium]MDD2908130.1 DNA polymerase III subunit gamma/tau [Candidatus Gracilibacteria bacterium]